MEALKGFKELAYGLAGKNSGDVLGMGDTDEIVSTKVRQNAIITEFHKLFLNTRLPFSHTFFALLEIAEAIYHVFIIYIYIYIYQFRCLTMIMVIN